MRLFNIICFSVALTTSCTRQTDPAPPVSTEGKPPLFQVGLVLDSPSSTSEPMVFTHKTKDGTQTNEVLNVWRIQRLDQNALEKNTWVWQRGDVVAVDVAFKEQSRRLLADLTRTNTGKPLALIINGKVTWTMRIGSEVDDGKMPIHGDWTLQDAQAFCKRMDAATTKR